MGQSIAEFNPVFQGAVRALMSACGGVGITSGFRSYAEQAALFKEKGAGWAARPGHSNHENPATGAAELNGDLDCAHRMAGQFGLHFPMKHEPWHIELMDGASSAFAYSDPLALQMEQLDRAFDPEKAFIPEGADYRAPILAEDVVARYQEGKPPERYPGFAGNEGVSGIPGHEGETWAEHAAHAEPYIAQPNVHPDYQAAIASNPGASLANRVPAPFAQKNLFLPIDQGNRNLFIPKDAGKRSFAGFGGGGAQGFTASKGPTGPGGATGSGGALNPVQAASYFAQAGFSGQALVNMVAIAIGESGLRPSAHGDTSIAGNGWGHSIGLAQIRSRVGESGRGTPRDPQKLEDPLFNARAAFDISGGGSNFRPWTVFTKGIYEQHLGTAQQAVAQLGGQVPAQQFALPTAEFQPVDTFRPSLRTPGGSWTGSKPRGRVARSVRRFARTF